MGRKRTIDRDAILDAAEAIVTEMGAGRLTFDEIARRAGVSKGGVLYCFPGKQELVAAMVRRDLDRFARDVAAHREAASEDGMVDMLAHLAATRHESDALAARAASLMAALAESPDHAGVIRDYYRERFERLELGDGERRGARAAFFAAEGAFLLRGLRMAEIGEAEWAALFEDLERLATEGRLDGTG